MYFRGHVTSSDHFTGFADANCNDAIARFWMEIVFAYFRFAFYCALISSQNNTSKQIGLVLINRLSALEVLYQVVNCCFYWKSFPNIC